MVEQEVRFTSGRFHLAGTLALPDREGLFAGVLLIPGSGQTDRNENTKKLTTNIFREMASHLGEHGIATMRYDKRGAGASDGNFMETGFLDNVSDASSALTYLKAQAQIRPEAVFLLGHSEGSLLATKLAAEGAEVAGVVLLSGSARSGEEVLKWQVPLIMKGQGGLNKWLIKLLRGLVMRFLQTQLNSVKRSSEDWYRTRTMGTVNAKWMREFMAYDPSEDLARIGVPILAITGSKDIQMPPQDLTRMAEIVHAPLEYHEVPAVSHILRVEEGEPSLSTYKEQVLQPVYPRVLHIVSEWLLKQVDASTHR